MSQCKCDLRTKLVGDGCRYCNPQEYIDNLIESLEHRNTWVGLTDDEVREIIDTYTTDDHGYDIWCDAVGVARAIEAVLRSKNHG